ncbi:hypothetical protein DPMN_127727 [Dreissena polymorpha]|uniref:Uncharacterized protein n=1 Tax=Dreissena polymorpha TaxID=45954 RepID=A0A9D4JWR9_DREPO|nr:hypothetical protein DPMN_127727 [Dreissena polymorpha]
MFNARGSRAGHIGTSPMTNIHPSTNAPHGARTFDLPIPRRTPYPLGHGDRRWWALPTHRFSGTGRSLICGAECETNAGELFRSLHEKDVPRSLCYTREKKTAMLPARTSCYSGFLMSSEATQPGKNYVCVDKDPGEMNGSHENKNGALLYLVEAREGLLRNNPYQPGWELSCAAKTKTKSNDLINSLVVMRRKQSFVRRGAPGLVMGPCIVEIDLIVIREVQYQLEVNRLKDLWPIMGGAPQVEIDRIFIKEVQYQFEVNRCRNEEIIVKGKFRWTWPMWAERPRINCIVIREVQYQFEVNRLKGNFGWAWPMWAGRHRIDSIVIKKVQYQFEVNRCRNEEIIVKGNFGRAWPMWPGRPRIDRIVIREAQYQFEVNRCRNEEVNVK